MQKTRIRSKCVWNPEAESKSNVFHIYKHRYFRHDKISGHIFGGFIWAFDLGFGLFLFFDDLCSGRNVAKYRKGLARMMLLISASVDRAICVVNASRVLRSAQAQEMSSPDGEQRPWSSTAGAVTNTLVVALQGFLLDEFSPEGQWWLQDCRDSPGSLPPGLPLW